MAVTVALRGQRRAAGAWVGAWKCGSYRRTDPQRTPGLQLAPSEGCLTTQTGVPFQPPSRFTFRSKGSQLHSWLPSDVDWHPGSRPQVRLCSEPGLLGPCPRGHRSSRPLCCPGWSPASNPVLAPRFRGPPSPWSRCPLAGALILGHPEREAGRGFVLAQF